MPPVFNFDTNNTLLDALRLIIVIAVPLAFLASIGLLSLYRRAVLRGMQTRSHSAGPGTSAAESNTPSAEPLQVALQIDVIHSTEDIMPKATSERLYTTLLRGPRRAAMIYALAGLCYALVTTLIFLRATKSGFHLLDFLIVFWYYAWPVAITLSLLAAATWQAKLKVFAVYFLMILLLGFIALIGSSARDWLQIVLLWFLTNLPAALLLLAFLNRRIQSVGPLVLTFMILAATGLVFLPTFIVNIGEIWNPLMSVRDALGLDFRAIFTVIFLTGVLGFGVLGWLAVQMIGRWYREKRISEQSITMDAIWLLFGIFQAVGLIFEGDHWFLASLLSFAVYKGVAWAGFKFTGRSTLLDEKPPTLLVLRVFSLGKRSERLFDMLAMHWRFAGSMQLIAGPDLAASTMEPHEFLDFLSGKLARRFIDSSQTLELRISQMDLRPDPDGQFRVNDFFCYDDTWRMVLSRLVRESDAVIMDLRGFSSQNAGCIFEISELISWMPLGQIVFIIDDSTDEPFLRQVLQQSWDRMSPASPNRLLTTGTSSLFRLDRFDEGELQRLLYVVSRAVPAASEMQVMTQSRASGLPSS